MKHPAEYILEKYKGRSSRFECPACRKAGEFTRYIHPVTGERLPKHVGLCNRRDKCGYFYTNWDYLRDNPNNYDSDYTPSPKLLPKPLPTFMDYRLVEKTMKEYSKNNLYLFMCSLVGEVQTTALFSRYRVGSSNHWQGASIYWQIDLHNRVRSGKVMLYNSETGKRQHKKQNWVHSILQLKNFNLSQCLYGEHLLTQKGNGSMPVAIVESEKTAIIASHFADEIIWLATGGLMMLNPATCPERFQSLKGRRVILYPDLGMPNKFNGDTPFLDWSRKVEMLKSQGINACVSDLLERKATDIERMNGYDIADYLINESREKREQF